MVFEHMETDLHAGRIFKVTSEIFCILHMKIKVCRSNQLKTTHNYYVLYQILSTLRYMHDIDIIHRDIKVRRDLL